VQSGLPEVLSVSCVEKEREKCWFIVLAPSALGVHIASETHAQRRACVTDSGSGAAAAHMREGVAPTSVAVHSSAMASEAVASSPTFETSLDFAVLAEAPFFADAKQSNVSESWSAARTQRVRTMRRTHDH
jgi:hypothetical protein